MDLAGRYLCPGLIDVHVHGILSRHVAQLEHMPEITVVMVKGGATGFLPSVGMLLRAGYAEYLAGITALRAAPPLGAYLRNNEKTSPNYFSKKYLHYFKK